MDKEKKKRLRCKKINIIIRKKKKNYQTTMVNINIIQQKNAEYFKIQRISFFLSICNIADEKKIYKHFSVRKTYL